MKPALLILIPIFLILSPLPAEEPVRGEGPRAVSRARADLELPDDLWASIRAQAGMGQAPLGYSADEMAHFRGSKCVLRNVEMLFRDITAVPRFTGRLSDRLLLDPADLGTAAEHCFSLLDARAGRVMGKAKLADWGVDWIPEGATSTAALQTILDLAKEAGVGRPITAANREQWELLPEAVRRLVVRTLIAAREAKKWLVAAVDQELLLSHFAVKSTSEITPAMLYAFASAPWQDGAEEPLPLASYEALDRFDMNYHAFGSKSFLRAMHAIVEEWRQAVAEGAPDLGSFARCEFETGLGKVSISGAWQDDIAGDASFVFDLGGDDNYTGATAVPRSLALPVSVVVDLGGNDTYDSQDVPAGLACGNHGIGAIYDLEGDDTYVADESGIACAWYGTGVVVDYAGNDRYVSRTWGQAAAHVGLALLVDLAGDDHYDCDTQSQAFGSTYGVGVLVDATGNDTYFADPEGNISETFEGRSVSFAQGTGFGRRADFGDGHSLGGGVGLLVDGAGDDRYTGSVYAQGAGYWWALGALEDRSGNDIYWNEQYSAGSAPHFAIGCLVDLEGNDRYNVGNEGLERQIQGHARDGSLAVFIDGAGDDEYLLTNLCAGSSDLNCLTLFWDRLGNDRYVCRRTPPRKEACSFGDCRVYSKFHTFRDGMPSVGIFLDTQGRDIYEELLPDDEERAKGLVPLKFADGASWVHRDLPHVHGIGRDLDGYSGLQSGGAPAGK